MNSRNLLLVLTQISPDGDDRPLKALKAWDNRPAVDNEGRNNAHDSGALSARDAILREFTVDYLSRAHDMWLPAGWVIVRALDFAQAVMADKLGSPMLGDGAVAERPRVRHEVLHAMRATLAWHYSLGRDDPAKQSVLINERVGQAIVAVGVSARSFI